MARLLTSGAELGAFDGFAGLDGGAFATNNTNPTFDTTTKRTGSFAYKCSASGASLVQWNQSVALGATAFLRFYIQVNTADGWPNVQTNVSKLVTSAPADILLVELTTTGQLFIEDSTGAQIGGSVQLAFDTWHRIEIKCLVPSAGNGTVALQVNGNSIVADTSWAIGNTAISTVLAGIQGFATGTVYIDDVALNDSTGTAQNSYPGEGSVTLLKPASDNARAGFTTDSAGITNLFAATDNTPPTGVVDTTVGTGLHQIRDATSSTTDNYDANLQTYTGAGVPSGATVKVVRAVMSNSAAATASPPNMALFLVSNAGGTTESVETSYATAGAAATWPTSWVTRLNTHLVITVQPTLGSAPVLRVGKRTASTRIAMCSFAGLIAEYTPLVTTIPNVNMAPFRSVANG